MSNLPVKTNPITTLRTMLEAASPKLAEVAPKHIKVDRLVRLMLSACSKTPKILECTPESVLTFCMKCSETGLEPIGAGGVWAIPYGKELTFIPDYRGLVNCAKRAECIKDAFAEAVYSNDEFDYELGMTPSLTHKPARGDRGTLESAYCILVFPDDTKRFVVMDGKEIDGIRKRSKAGGAGPWQTDQAEMWKKTVIRRALKPFAGASQQLDAAITADDAINGLKSVNDRTPVPMPRAIDEAPASPEATPEPTPTPEVAPDATATPPVEQNMPSSTPIEVPDGCEVAEGILRGIEPKKMKYREDGKNHKNGDEFTSFSYVLDDGSKYSSFSETEANDNAEAVGKSVRLVYKPNGAYRNFVNIYKV